MLTIMIVEDSPTQAEQLRTLFEAESWTVCLAEDGLAALRLLKDAPVDLVVSDIVMPKISGYELCRRIKEDRDTPVLLLSSLNEPMDIIRGLEAGADNFVTKPYQPEALVNRIKTLFESRKLRASQKVGFGVEIVFLGKHFTITSEREQIVDLLMSTFEDTVRANRELQKSRSELAAAKMKLEEYALVLESRVHASEEKYATLVENASSGILLCDREGLIKEANHEASRLAGRSLPKLLGCRIDDFAPHVMVETKNYWEKVLEEGAGRLHTVALAREDGNRTWVDVTASTITIDETDYVQVIWHDATERKLLEDRLRRAQRRRYSLLLDSTREIVMFVDRDSRQIIEANTAALEAYGYTRDEFVALRVEDIRLPDFQVEMQDLIDRMEDGLLLETTAVRKDGSTFPIELAIRPAELDGRSMILSVGRDITERKNTMRDLSNALEKAQAAGKLKSEFVATVSHEIRTPLTGIIGMSELLQATKLDDDQLDSLRTIHESSTALLKIINDILDFSKIEAGHGELESVDFDLSPLVEGVVHLMNRVVKRESVTLMTYVSPKVPAAFRGDPGRLRQILMNLVGNAVKFTERGFVVVSVDLVRTSNGLAVLRFEVADTGIGMDEEARTKLFQPFQQGDASTARRFGGTGLGLAICKSYVEMMQGAIRVESTVGEGTTVTFDVALQVAESDASRRDTTLVSQRRLLVIDSDSASRCMIEKYTSDWNMIVATAAGEDQALRVLASAHASQRPFDIVIVSFPLAGASALELASSIKNDEAAAGTRLLMLASQRIDGGFARAEQAGFEAVLTKPITQSSLFDRLVTMLGGTPSAGIQSSQLDAFCPLDRSLRVLVAEDNAVNRRVAQRQLQALGCEPVMVENGLEAIAALEKSQFDVVLMDCNMPVMDGFAATTEIRRRQRTGQTARTRIIALTANASEDDRQRCLVAGMDGYLSKPILLGQLREALQNLPVLA